MSQSKIRDYKEAAKRLTQYEGKKRNLAPTARDIAHEAGEKGQIAINQVRKHFWYIAHALRQDGFFVIIVNQKFYDLYGAELPLTIQEATQCLPNSQNPRSGLYFLTKPNELMFLAKAARDRVTALNSLVHWDEFIANAKRQGLASDNIREIIQHLVDRASAGALPEV